MLRLLQRVALALFIGFFLFSINDALFAQMKWHQAYAAGLKAMKNQEWRAAIRHFSVAMDKKSKDKDKTRAYGAVFISYYPNRETGIAYYYLGDYERARGFLQRAQRQARSVRGRNFFKKAQKLASGSRPSPPPVYTPPPKKQIEEPEPTYAKPDYSSKTPPPAKIDRPEEINVGERLSVAILPFDTKGVGDEFGDIDMLDKLTTAFVNLNRFKVVERAQLERILSEQKLGLSGIVDVSTAVKIGAAVGVETVVCGSIVRSRNSVSIDARLVDTESAEIISAQDAFATKINLLALSEMIQNVAAKIKRDVPVVSGVVVSLQNNRLTLDLGKNNGALKGMKCYVFREGDSIIHPKTKEVIGKIFEQICEVRLVEVFDGYSIAKITQSKNGVPQVLDRVITK